MTATVPVRIIGKNSLNQKAMRETVGSVGPHSDPGRVQARRKSAEGRRSLLSRKPNEGMLPVGDAGIPRYRERVCWYADNRWYSEAITVFVLLSGRRLFFSEGDDTL